MSRADSRSLLPGRATDRRLRRRALRWGITISLLGHLGLLVWSPPLNLLPPERLHGPPALVVLPPEPSPPPIVETPAGPVPIPPPARPVVREGATPPVEERPVWVPHEVPPSLLNPGDIGDYLEMFYPPDLRLARLEGSVLLWLYVDRSGTVRQAQVRDTYGAPDFADLALSAATLMRFRPALAQSRPVGVWVSQRIRFQVTEPEAVSDAGTEVAAAGSS